MFSAQDQAEAFASLSSANRAAVLIEVYKRYGEPFQTLNKATGKLEGVVDKEGYPVNGIGSRMAAIAIRRKNFVTKNDLIIKAKAVDSNLGSYLRHAALLLRISNNFMLYIADKKGHNASIVAQFSKGTNTYGAGSHVLSYDDFSELHNYIINQKIKKLTKFVSYSRMRLGGSVSGVNALFYPCGLSTAMKKAVFQTAQFLKDEVANGRYPAALSKSLVALVANNDADAEDDVYTINSRNILKDFFIRSVTPDAESGSYVTFPKNHPFLTLLDTAALFIGVPKELETLQERANKEVLEDDFIRAAVKSSKNKKIKEIYSPKRDRTVNEGRISYKNLLANLRVKAVAEDTDFSETYGGTLDFASEKTKAIDSLIVELGYATRVNSYVVSTICAGFTWGKGDSKFTLDDRATQFYFGRNVKDIVDEVSGRVDRYKKEKEDLVKAGQDISTGKGIDIVRETRARDFVVAYNTAFKYATDARAQRRNEKAVALRKARKGGISFNPRETN
jgi:hypothetical protein